MPPLNKIAILRDRAYMLSQARAFFAGRQLLEVDCPILSPSASVDSHIDLMYTANHSQARYLHSSPEYGMKRLLAQGIGDIYQLSHVFRHEEQGLRHNPEFMMAEWYRIGMPFLDLIEETADFMRLFLGEMPAHLISYREAFNTYMGFDYLSISSQELIEFLGSREIKLHDHALEGDKEALLNLILGLFIEPQLGQEELTVLAYYPASQAALAKTQWRDDEQVAERFEIYYQGLELCNGYHELLDPVEQRLRFLQANQARQLLGKETLPLDDRFLQALTKGLPECCGVAVGFDRLMMLRHHLSDIRDVLSFAWDEA
jgi:lysyl-tRNA synthetase class 2